MQSWRKPVKHYCSKPPPGFVGVAGGCKRTSVPTVQRTLTAAFCFCKHHECTVASLLPQFPVVTCPVLCSGSVRSRYAEFQLNCQPSAQAASGCRRDSYAACLLAYTGIIGKGWAPAGAAASQAGTQLLWVGHGSSGRDMALLGWTWLLWVGHGSSGGTRLLWVGHGSSGWDMAPLVGHGSSGGTRLLCWDTAPLVGHSSSGREMSPLTGAMRTVRWRAEVSGTSQSHGMV